MTYRIIDVKIVLSLGKGAEILKKFLLRGKKSRAISTHMPHSLEYGVWYNLVTPFDWQYFKLKKGSRYVRVYDFIHDEQPAFTVTRKRFVEEILTWAKSPPRPVDLEEYYEDFGQDVIF